MAWSWPAQIAQQYIVYHTHLDISQIFTATFDYPTYMNPHSPFTFEISPHVHAKINDACTAHVRVSRLEPLEVDWILANIIKQQKTAEEANE